MTDGKTAREQYGDSEVDAIEQANKQKRRLFEPYRKGRGKIGISARYSSVEGDWVYTWLLVEDRSARFIKDSTRDPRGSAAGVATHTLKSMKLGSMRENKFVEGELAPTDSPVIVLEMACQKGGMKLYH